MSFETKNGPIASNSWFYTGWNSYMLAKLDRKIDHTIDRKLYRNIERTVTDMYPSMSTRFQFHKLAWRFTPTIASHACVCLIHTSAHIVHWIFVIQYFDTTVPVVAFVFAATRSIMVAKMSVPRWMDCSKGRFFMVTECINTTTVKNDASHSFSQEFRVLTHPKILLQKDTSRRQPKTCRARWHRPNHREKRRVALVCARIPSVEPSEVPQWKRTRLRRSFDAVFNAQAIDTTWRDVGPPCCTFSEYCTITRSLQTCETRYSVLFYINPDHCVGSTDA